MRLTPYGKQQYIAAGAFTLALAPVAIVMQWWWMLAILAVGWIIIAGFFRDPHRRPAQSDISSTETALSPADGTISAIERVEAHEATNGKPAIIIRIFLSVFNVHVNRSPLDCIVVKTIHRPGRYLDARKALSAKVNESNLIVLRRGDEHFGVRQVSGAVARRIVCPLVADQNLAQGERFGMIKFGSTTELILPNPDHVEPLVQVGDAVRGGQTLLAHWPVNG